jgi:hypothetical protein
MRPESNFKQVPQLSAVIPDANGDGIDLTPTRAVGFSLAQLGASN